ncbi:MAG: GntR family transcriptional regulator [Candidatus Krumholzibacteria bacterium]|jgi:DNA-binding GntR family transcriptional regulator|nr:GntR family transcriptional regulator [Candidatus Krumholzibacteria bacterium]
MLIQRKPLRADVGAEILSRLIDGRLPSGTRINESHLSAELGLSRTPLREAMLCLAAEGFLGSDMGRGFSVPHFTGREVRELSVMLAAVLPIAIREDDRIELKDSVEAGNLIGRIRMHRQEPGAFCEQFYALLRLLGRLGGNSVLSKECNRLARLLLRYFYEALARGWNPDEVLGDLHAGIEQLQAGQRGAAAATMEQALQRLGADLAVRFPAALQAPA